MTSLECDRALEEQASALTTCSICTDVFKVPKVLPCQHTFCLCCLERHHDATNSQRLVPVSSFACPTCRKVCYVPRHSLDQLPTDFKVDQILDLVKVMSRSRRSSSLSTSPQKNTDVQGQSQGQVPLSECAVCRSARAVATPSEVFCVQCARSFCSACAEHHSRTSVFRDHAVVPAAAAASVSGAWRCTLHDLDVLYFCDQCEAPACTICVLSIHECHSVSDQREVISRLRHHLTQSFERLQQRRDDFKSQLDELALLRQEHLRNLQDTERTVIWTSREAYRKIRELEEQTLTDVRSCNKEKLDRLSSAERELSGRLESLAELCHSYSDVLALTDLKMFFDSYSQLAIKDEQEAREAGPELEPTLRDASTFVARIQVRLGDVEKRMIDVDSLPRHPPQKVRDGSLALEAESKRTSMMAKKDTEPTPLPELSPRLNPPTFQGHGHGHGQGQSEHQGRSQRRGRREEFLNTLDRRQIHSSTSSINNTLTSEKSSTSSHNKNFSGSGTFSNTNSSNGSSSSNGSTLNSTCKSTKSNSVGLSFDSTNRISSSSSSIESSGSRNSTITSNNSCSTTSTSYTGNSSRHMVERSKSTPRSNENQSTKSTRASRNPDCDNDTPQLLWVAEDFSRCSDCTFASSGHLVATDNAVVSNRVQMFTYSDGHLVDTVDSCLIVQPWGLCYNESSSSILLTDHGNPSLKTIRIGSTREVRVYRSQADRPSGVAVTRSGDLVLTDTGDSRRLRRFNVGVYAIVPGGRLSKTREFGCHGDGEGEVLRANYVIVDHNDRVVVSDCESHTVKVFSLAGQQLLRFSSSWSDGREMCPQGVAVDDHNNILVADQAVGAVVKFSPHGQLIDTVVQTSGTPWGISVSWEENMLAVATSRGLEVYRL